MNESVVFRHAEDLAFLWELRSRALRGGQLTFEARARLDMRLDGHLDGLRIAGRAGWLACAEALESSARPGEVFAAAALALSGTCESRVERAFQRVGDDDSAMSALVSAAGWSDFVSLEPRLRHWGTSSDPWLRRVALAGYTAHRRPCPSLAADALRGEEPCVASTAAKAAGALGMCDQTDALRDLLGGGHAASFEAARALARLQGDSVPVRDALLGFAEAEGPYAERAVASLLQAAPRDALPLFRRWAGERRFRRLAARAAEVIGEHAVVPDLITWMGDDDVARAAGRAFQAITGADIAESDLARARPKVKGDPTDDPSDDHVALDDDYELPFPSPLKVAGWWRAQSARFVPGTRYLAGSAIALGSAPPSEAHLTALREIVRRGRASHQTMAALTLAHHVPGLPAIETHAPAVQAREVPAWKLWARLRSETTRAPRLLG